MNGRAVIGVVSGVAAGMLLMVSTPADAQPRTDQELSKQYGKDSDPVLNMKLTFTKKEVREAQLLLKEHGYDPLATDGIFWPWTRDAIIRCQKDHGLPVTGKFDKVTLDHLREPHGQASPPTTR
jgi:peptidoglycan hydrolase-like protein with peptidoglycan-binding domain